MTQPFPLVINFEGDYGMKVFMIDPELTIDEMASYVRGELEGVILRPLPADTKLSVLRNSDGSAVDGGVKVGDAGFIKLEAFDIVCA